MGLIWVCSGEQADDLSQKDSETWFGDVAGSRYNSKEMATGFFEMHKGKALDYYYGQFCTGNQAILR